MITSRELHHDMENCTIACTKVDFTETLHYSYTVLMDKKKNIKHVIFEKSRNATDILP